MNPMEHKAFTGLLSALARGTVLDARNLYVLDHSENEVVRNLVTNIRALHTLAAPLMPPKPKKGE